MKKRETHFNKKYLHYKKFYLDPHSVFLKKKEQERPFFLNLIRLDWAFDNFQR